MFHFYIGDEIPRLFDVFIYIMFKFYLYYKHSVVATMPSGGFYVFLYDLLSVSSILSIEVPPACLTSHSYFINIFCYSFVTQSLVPKSLWHVLLRCNLSFFGDCRKKISNKTFKKNRDFIVTI